MMMMMMMMNIMVDNSETFLDGYIQTKPSLYAETDHLEPKLVLSVHFFRNFHFGKNVLVLRRSSAVYCTYIIHQNWCTKKIEFFERWLVTLTLRVPGDNTSMWVLPIPLRHPPMQLWSSKRRNCFGKNAGKEAEMDF